MSKVSGKATIAKSPICKDPVISCTNPTSGGPIAPTMGSNVIPSPVATAVSRGSNCKSKGIALMIGTQIWAFQPEKKRRIPATMTEFVVKRAI